MTQRAAFFSTFDKFVTSSAYAAEHAASLWLSAYGVGFYFFFLFFVLTSTLKFVGSRRGSEYCGVFNPLYLWGLCSIWYQICISQMGFDCFPHHRHAYESTCADTHMDAPTHLYSYLLIYTKSGICIVDVNSYGKKNKWMREGVSSLLSPTCPPCWVSSTWKQTDSLFAPRLRFSLSLSFFKWCSVCTIMIQYHANRAD